MINLMQDTQALHNTMDDFSEKYGDQALIKSINEWLEIKMGEFYEINNIELGGKK